MTTEVDRDEALKELYRAGRSPRLVDVPELDFLMIDGQGDPERASSFTEAVQALYGVAYTVKFARKAAGRPDVRIGPLEGLWWADDMARLTVEDRDAFRWTLLIRVPGDLTAADVERSAGEVERKKALAAARGVRLERFHEGLAAQVLHVGPYATEAETIAVLHRYVHEQGLGFDGHVQKHHEIYLGDPRRSAPERLRTIIRQPVRGRVPGG